MRPTLRLEDKQKPCAIRVGYLLRVTLYVGWLKLNSFSPTQGKWLLTG